MNVTSLARLLKVYPDKFPRFILPNGKIVPGHFHVTEVGHVIKNFIDCGGTIRKTESCVLQTWTHDDDKDHRLTADRFAEILRLGEKILPSGDLPVEVEYEDAAISQYPIESGQVAGDYLDFLLTAKHTDCLAREKCCAREDACCSATAEAACC